MLMSQEQGNCFSRRPPVRVDQQQLRRCSATTQRIGRIRMFESLCARYALTGMLMLGAAVPALTEAAPDSTLFTTYNVSTDLESAQWGVCGSTAQSEGCYSFGNIGPFCHIGSMLEGEPVVNGNTVTRDVYILD